MTEAALAAAGSKLLQSGPWALLFLCGLTAGLWYRRRRTPGAGLAAAGFFCLLAEVAVDCAKAGRLLLEAGQDVLIYAAGTIPDEFASAPVWTAAGWLLDFAGHALLLSGLWKAWRDLDDPSRVYEDEVPS